MNASDENGPGATATPVAAEVLIGLAGPPLLEAMRDRRAGGELVVITDDRDSLETAAADATIIELQELLPRGVSDIEDAWDRGMAAWLRQLFPSTVSGFELAELMWVNLLAQPELRTRIDAVALADTLFRRFAPRSISIIGALPTLCVTVPAEARRRGIPLRGAPSRLRDLAHWPEGLANSLARLVKSATRAVSRVRERRRMAPLLASVARGASTEPPRLWAVLSAKWPQNSRHVLDQILGGCESEQLPYGVAFSMTYGEGAEAAEGQADELSLFDGTLGRFSPSAIDQVTGATDWLSLLRLLWRWAPLSIRCCVRCVRFAGAFRVNQQVASLPGDIRALLRVATNDVLRVLDVEIATESWLANNPGARTVVFSSATSAENKVADRMMQRAGKTTVDFLHGEVSGSALRTLCRSWSSYHASWTMSESHRFAQIGTNQHTLGGFMPRMVMREKISNATPRILVTTNYIHQFYLQDGRITTLKYARRLARAITQLIEHLHDRAHVVLRPHPHEDRETWRALLDPQHPPTFSAVTTLAEDLARADIVITTLGSSAIEAICYGVPVLFHRGPAMEPRSLFGSVATRRWFATGAELSERIDALLDGSTDATPERELLQACFGASERPRSIMSLLKEIDPELARVS